jgi:hypothetical protein
MDKPWVHGRQVERTKSGAHVKHINLVAESFSGLLIGRIQWG